MGKIEKQEIEVKYNIGAKSHEENFGSYAAFGKWYSENYKKVKVISVGNNMKY
ncbi:hypothetical protein [Clostridium sp.]|uniref:hypothetical protein n=1 Tax=Clostridium sp. TaxID=1506 RepID=UPI001D63F0B6|nr:hypothetical protein [Clostridium sp.]MBS5308760.1 hypothetical protein [Clostridium sp.]